jgi:phenylacetate-CoA ligase
MIFNRDIECCDREILRQHQLSRLKILLITIYEKNPFYTQKLKDAGLIPGDLTSLDNLPDFPLTTKDELSKDQEAYPPYGTNLTYSLEEYIRYHQTSGTTGKPLRILDTRESWEWWIKCWNYIYLAAGVRYGDRVFFGFSFGPFIGFWTAFDGAQSLGCMGISGGGQDSLQRLNLILKTHATVLVSTPSYALRLASIAQENGIDLSGASIRVTIHAGEPGASIPATKKKIETAWGAKCFDHTGATEVGAYGYECIAQSGGVHLNEGEFIAEVIDPGTGKSTPKGGTGELVITNLGRWGNPVIRYRTGDLVELDDEPCTCGRRFARMIGGIIGRTDDMITVRGVNVFPSAIENIVHQFSEIEEFSTEIYREKEMEELHVKLEIKGSEQEKQQILEKVSEAFRSHLNLRTRITLVETGSLPRFEMKARRFKVIEQNRD